MFEELPPALLQKYPQLEQIFAAIEEFKKTGSSQIRCINCSDIVEVKENKIEGILEANCPCGKSKYRMRWDPDKV